MKHPDHPALDACQVCGRILVVPLFPGDDRHIHAVTDHKAVR